jgi:hypothetical protein
METSQDNRRFIWSIDAADKIVQVNDDWLAFARENDAPQLTAAAVLGQFLWRYIWGRETVHLYKQILGRLRAGKTLIKFPFRCDSPDCRRFMEMTLSLLSGQAVQFSAKLIRLEYRQPLDFLDPSQDRSGEFLKICSWCKKIYIPDRGWQELEEGIEALDLFGHHSIPRMTHTICDSCYDFVKQELSQE